MELSNNGHDHAGNPLVTVKDGDTTYDIDVTMMVALFGIIKGLPTHRAGTCTRLKQRGLIEGDGNNWTLTDQGTEVLVFCVPVIVECVENI